MAILNKNEKVGRYVVTFFIKQGSYAETYRVKDSLGKNFFLKLINCAKLHRSQFDEAGNVLELQIAKQLRHSNVTTYHDNGTLVLNGQKFIFLVLTLS